MTQLSSGQSLASRFTLLRRLGKGGMGEVWLARDEEMGTELVTKIVPGHATPEQISLLRQECRNARRLSHPNIVRVFDFHQDPAASFITMEPVSGGDLCALRGSTPGRIIEAILPVVDALQYAHSEGIIHRDLKCANVLIDAAGRPRLSDFGIAGLATPGPGDLQVAGGGSGHHASPQQQAGQAPSVADDIFSLGVMLQELLGSDQPLPERLTDLLAKMTSAAVADRPADLSAVRSSLLEFAEVAEEVTLPPRIAKREIRLAPPPRVAAVRPEESQSPRGKRPSENAETTRHSYWWLTVATFLILALVVLAVFTILPKWVEQRGRVAVGKETTLAPEPVETSKAAVTPSPESVAAPASEPVRQAPEAEPPETAEFGAANPDEPEDEPSIPTEMIRRPSVSAPAPLRPGPDPSAEAFAEAMTQGLSALEASDFAAAQKAFEQALAESPGSAEAADGLARAQRALRLASIKQYRERAEVLEEEERWRDAETEYRSALALDSTLRFAQEGKVRVGRRAELSEQMNYHLDHPERLVDDRVLAEAREVLATAEAVDWRTPGLETQIARLRQVLEIASTPVQVILESDNSTEVVVYRVGRLGRFERRELELRPGTYTIVGTRDGYRDVRRQLKVEPGSSAPLLKVRCEEKI